MTDCSRKVLYGINYTSYKFRVWNCGYVFRHSSDAFSTSGDRETTKEKGREVFEGDEILEGKGNLSAS